MIIRVLNIFKFECNRTFCTLPICEAQRRGNIFTYGQNMIPRLDQSLYRFYLYLMLNRVMVKKTCPLNFTICI